MHKLEWPKIAGMNRFDGLDPARTALIVVDLQVGFVEEGYPGYGPHVRDILPNVNRLAAALRAAGGLVVHTRHTTLDDPVRGPPPWQKNRPDMQAYFASLEPGAPGHALHPALDVAGEDVVIDKVRYSAFLPISSPLDEILRTRNIDTVIITGTVTNICCESSARDAEMMGYRVFFVADATAAISDDQHNATLAIMTMVFADVRLTDDMIALIGASSQSAARRAG